MVCAAWWCLWVISFVGGRMRSFGWGCVGGGGWRGGRGGCCNWV